METVTVVQIAIFAVIVWIVVLVIIRKLLEKSLLEAIANGDSKKYRRICMSPFTLILLQPNRIRLLRAICYLDMNDDENARKYLSQVNIDILEPKEKLMYLNAAISVGLNSHDEAYYDSIEETFQKVEKYFPAPKIIEKLHQDYHINKKLYFTFDETVINDLKKIAQEQKGNEKGMTFITLAKAYHYSGNTEKVNATLSEAINLLKDTGYSDLAKSMMNDHSLLD